MNIRQAIYENGTECILVDESYYAKIMVNGLQETNYPVDFSLTKMNGTIIDTNDLFFRYDRHVQRTNVTKGEYLLNKYYPIGSVLTIETKQYKIKSYGDCVIVAGAMRVPVYTECINDDNVIVSITNKGIEDRVQRELQSIVFAHTELQRLLPYYDPRRIDFSEQNANNLNKLESLKRIYDIRSMEDCEYNYLLNNTNAISDLQDETNKFREEFKSFMTRYNYEKMKFVLNGVWANLNVISLMKWILYNRDLKKDYTGIDNDFKERSVIEVYSTRNKSIVIDVYTTSSAPYNYRIELDNVVRCRMNKTYYNYIMDNIRVYYISKCKCNNETTELVNLTGEGANDISAISKKIKPSKCLIIDGACINNCVPGNCSEPNPNHCVNRCNKDDNKCNCDCNKPCTPDCGVVDIIDPTLFNESFFNILCKLMCYICGSHQSVEISGVGTSDEYYGLLNNMIIKLIEDFKSTITDPDDIYCNTSEEFVVKYSKLLGKTLISITVDDKDEVMSAIDEYNHLPDDEKLKIADQYTLLLNFKKVIDGEIIPVDGNIDGITLDDAGLSLTSNGQKVGNTIPVSTFEEKIANEAMNDEQAGIITSVEF